MYERFFGGFMEKRNRVLNVLLSYFHNVGEYASLIVKLYQSKADCVRLGE
jgi:hypothetical protein